MDIHAINNQLQAILSFAELIQMKAGDIDTNWSDYTIKELIENCNTIIAAAKTINYLVLVEPKCEHKTSHFIPSSMHFQTGKTVNYNHCPDCGHKLKKGGKQ